MQTVIGIILVAVFIALFFGARIARKRVMDTEFESFAEKENSYTLIVRGYDWGPAVPKAIVNVGEREQKFTQADCTTNNFTVTVSSYENGKESPFVETKKRTITKVYPCDIDGNELDNYSEATHLAFEFDVHPSDSFFSPFIYDMKKQVNEWKKEYAYSFESSLFDGNITTENHRYCPEADLFKDVKVAKNNRLHAASFSPKVTNGTTSDLTSKQTARAKHPLIVWLHGAGEGGKDPSIAVLGNKVTATVGEKIQSYFGGAYVLCPQTPTVWMNAGEGPYDIMNPANKNKTSQYTKECKQVIDDFISAHKDIDTNRIYICGCSNGGYMTMNMLLTYPHFFAAAAPVCEAYGDSWITDEQLLSLAKEHIWFTAAKNDTTVPPKANAEATVERLLSQKDSLQKTPDVHFSYFDDVHDTSGSFFGIDSKPYQYFGHWSWIYFFNDECADEKEASVWKWMAEQSLVKE